LGDAIRRAGGDVARLRAGHVALEPARIARFVELHIEQGPVLIEAGRAIGVVTGICGSLRFRAACGIGAYMHSGATPRSHRRDAVVGVSALVLAMQRDWAELEALGHELTVTTGCFSTDPRQADFSKVAGRVDFCIDLRSRSPATLAEMAARLRRAVMAVEAAHGIAIDLGPRTGSEPAVMDPGLRAGLVRTARGMALAHREMPSGAGHDAAVFAGMGVPSAMIFVRNAHGSHNPDEAMDLADFADAARLLAAALDDDFI
ncbi:MAG: M20/M25/M40 family metallo-hydrolase, partial [Janthinobacterium lividum]